MILLTPAAAEPKAGVRTEVLARSYPSPLLAF